jgi:integrase
MNKSNKHSKWPHIRIAKHRSGQVSYQVDLGFVEGKRKRRNFATKVDAEAFAELSRVLKANEGTSALALPQAVRLDATKANQILAPHGISILEAARHYEKHVLAYKTAPPVKDIVEIYITDCKQRNLRPRTIEDVEDRLRMFSADFGERRLSEVTLDELKEWINDENWEMQTRINYLTKLSQLYRFALRRPVKWVDSNLTELIDRPAVEDTEPKIFTVEQARSLLANADRFELLPYMALGLFAGLRSAELMRLDTKDISFEALNIRIGSDVAKKRAQRHVEIQPALFAWLQHVADRLKKGGAVADKSRFRMNKELLLEAAGIQDWPINGLRHSFASYHLAQFNSSDQTALQMGHRSTELVHRYYKALVMKPEAEKFWNLYPETTERTAQPLPRTNQNLTLD